MKTRSITVFELAPAADELWELEQDSRSGYLYHDRGVAALPDVARGAKIRPRVSAAYASGKATNIARVFDAFLRPQAEAPLARLARDAVRARLLTFLPGCHSPYHSPDIPGDVLSQFTPGGAYLACLQARDFSAVELSVVGLPPTHDLQADRRCANIVAADGGELCNFSPYLLWTADCVTAALDAMVQGALVDVIGLAGSLPQVDGAPSADIYARAIRGLKRRNPQVIVSLDVGGAPIRSCLQGGPDTSPDLFCINMDEYLGAGRDLWARHAGTVIIHNKRGCWIVSGEAPTSRELLARGPDIPTPADVRVIHTICAGDAAHGGLLLGVMLYGRDTAGLRKAAVLSQACAIAVVESPDSIRGLTAEKVQANLERFPAQ